MKFFFKWVLFFFSLIIINNKYLNKQSFTTLIYDYFFEQQYNNTHCIDFYLNNCKDFECCNKCLDFQNCTNFCVKQKLNRLKIHSPIETLQELINNNKSISRFGDGEFNLIFGRSISFQKANKLLSKRLKNVLESNEEGLLIGLSDFFTLKNECLNKLENKTKKFLLNFIEKNKFKLIFFNTDKIYYSSFISRFYYPYKDKSGVSKYIKKLKKIWEQKDILIIEGEKSRIGIGNDLFNNTNSIKRILCPSINAFELYDKILNEALKIDKNKLILLALGPTATVLSYDLYKAGYHVIDIGHVDIEYEWFLRNASNVIKIEGKFVNEAKGGNINIKDIKDKNYYEQIIAKVLK